MYKYYTINHVYFTILEIKENILESVFENVALLDIISGNFMSFLSKNDN